MGGIWGAGSYVTSGMWSAKPPEPQVIINDPLLPKKEVQKNNNNEFVDLVPDRPAIEKPPPEVPVDSEKTELNVSDIQQSVLLQKPQKSKPEEANQNVDLSEDGIDIEVVRTNWYWRHQRRVYRFAETSFMRLGTDGTVKDTFDYDTVKEIIFTDHYNIIIKFTNNKEPQYIRSARSYEIARIIQDHAVVAENIKIKLP